MLEFVRCGLCCQPSSSGERRRRLRSPRVTDLLTQAVTSAGWSDVALPTWMNGDVRAFDRRRSSQPVSRSRALDRPARRSNTGNGLASPGQVGDRLPRLSDKSGVLLAGTRGANVRRRDRRSATCTSAVQKSTLNSIARLKSDIALHAVSPGSRSQLWAARVSRQVDRSSRTQSLNQVRPVGQLCGVAGSVKRNVVPSPG